MEHTDFTEEDNGNPRASAFRHIRAQRFEQRFYICPWDIGASRTFVNLL